MYTSWSRSPILSIALLKQKSSPETRCSSSRASLETSRIFNLTKFQSAIVFELDEWKAKTRSRISQPDANHVAKHARKVKGVWWFPWSLVPCIQYKRRRHDCLLRYETTTDKTTFASDAFRNASSWTSSRSAPYGCYPLLQQLSGSLLPMLVVRRQRLPTNVMLPCHEPRVLWTIKILSAECHRRACNLTSYRTVTWGLCCGLYVARNQHQLGALISVLAAPKQTVQVTTGDIFCTPQFTLNDGHWHCQRQLYIKNRRHHVICGAVCSLLRAHIYK